jgi:hypothetical protein
MVGFMKFFQIVLLLLFSSSLGGQGLLIKKSGVLEGILSAKGEAWIDVREDGGLLDRYLAPWSGESPARGGGFDLKTLGEFKELIVGNRVYLDWFWDGHLRVRKVREIKPSQKAGFFTGMLINKGDKWIEVEGTDNPTPWRFYARWVGGLPEEGGRYHSRTLEFFGNFEISNQVRFYWTYDHRPRIERFIEQEDDTFIPFYYGKTVPGSTNGIPPVSPVVNPFDQVSPATPVNPFDQLPAGKPNQALPNPSANPFEQVLPSVPGNPFDSALPSNPMPRDANPFVSPPEAKELNPFEDVPLPGNPFDTIPQQ